MTTTPKEEPKKERQQKFLVDPVMYQEMGYEKDSDRPAFEEFDKEFSGHQRTSQKLTSDQKKRLASLQKEQQKNKKGHQFSNYELGMASQVLEPEDPDTDVTLMTNNPHLQKLIKSKQGRSMNSHEAMEQIQDNNKGDLDVQRDTEDVNKTVQSKQQQKAKRMQLQRQQMQRAIQQWQREREAKRQARKEVMKAVGWAALEKILPKSLMKLVNFGRQMKGLYDSTKMKAMGKDQDFDPEFADQQMDMGGGMDQQRMGMQQQMGMQNEFAMGVGAGYFMQMQMMQMQEMMRQMQQQMMSMGGPQQPPGPPKGPQKPQQKWVRATPSQLQQKEGDEPTLDTGGTKVAPKAPTETSKSKEAPKKDKVDPELEKEGVEDSMTKSQTTINMDL